MTGEGITPAPVCEQGLRFEEKAKSSQRDSHSSAQPRLAARAFPVELLKGKQEAHEQIHRTSRPICSHFHPIFIVPIRDLITNF